MRDLISIEEFEVGSVSIREMVQTNGYETEDEIVEIARGLDRFSFIDANSFEVMVQERIIEILDEEVDFGYINDGSYSVGISEIEELSIQEEIERGIYTINQDDYDLEEFVIDTDRTSLVELVDEIASKIAKSL